MNSKEELEFVTWNCDLNEEYAKDFMLRQKKKREIRRRFEEELMNCKSKEEAEELIDNFYKS